jgi:hypothetical protein
MSGGERSSESRMTANEAVRQIRREAVRLRAARAALERVQGAIAAPSLQELTEMERGERPVTFEAHLLGALQAVIGGLENVEDELRIALARKTLSRLERDWQRLDLPNERDLRLIRAAVTDRKA